MGTKKYLSLDRLIEYDALIKAEINSAVSDKAESDHIHDNATTSAAGFMSASDKVKIDAFNGALQTATTPATTGWYRIATSAVGISVCSGIFQIRATEAGRHTSAIITANTTHGLPNSTGINVLACSNWTTAALTQARIVHHPSSSGNYAYLEVYLNVAATVKITVNMISGLGWTLIAPNTVGEIPSGYQSKTVSLLDNVATPTSKGLMSSADKTKLDAVPETISDGELIAFVEYTEDDIQALWDSVVV